MSPAEQSLKGNLNRSPIRSRFNIAEDAENAVPARSPAKSPAKSPGPSFLANLIAKDKENRGSYGFRSQHASPERRPATGHSTAPSYTQPASSQGTAPSQNDDIFSPPQTQSTQPTQATQSFAQSTNVCEEERRDTGDSFVSAKEAFGSKQASNEDLRAKYSDDAMEVDNDQLDEAHPDAHGTAIHHELSSDADNMAIDELPAFPQPPKRNPEAYNDSTGAHSAPNAADQRINVPEPQSLMPPAEIFPASDRAEAEDAQHDDTVVHYEVEDNMDIDDDDVRSTSDSSSPVKPLVRKSSLTFASLPAREPLIAKKSMGNRNSRTSHVDPNKARGSTLGRFTGGKSLGGSQLPPPDSQQDAMDVDDERPDAPREELEATKLHNKTSSQRLLERINMLKQQNEPPKRISQNILASQMSQAASFTASQIKESVPPSQSSQPTTQPTPVSQPTYPSLPPAEPEQSDDDDDDWISPIRTVAPAPNPSRPPFSKSHSAETRPSPAKAVPKPISVSNPDLPAVVESTTPVGSPTGKKYMDGPLSASKAKFYSALRAAKEKIIGSNTTSAQVKLDALSESPVRPTIKSQQSADDVFTSPKRNEKAGTSIFSHLRSPSKESLKSSKTKAAAMPSSPAKEDGRRTRSSTEREKQKEKDLREKQRVDDRLKEMRSKEQLKAAAHHQKVKATTTKTPSAMASQQSLRQTAVPATKTPVSVAQPPQSRPQPTRADTATSNEFESADEMPPPPPPKSFLPTTGQKIREPRKAEPKKLVKPNSKETLPKAKPQKIMVSLHNSRYGQAPPAASKHAASVPAPPTAAPVAAKSAPSTQRMGPPAAKPNHTVPARPASALSTKSAASYKTAPKPAPRVARPAVQKPAEKPMEKPKTVPAPPRADLAASRPVARMQTIQDANRIQVPPVNPAKPAKRPFEHDESTLQRPPKRPSTQAKMNPITPAHPNSQFAKGKIPFAEPSQSAKTPQPQYQNGEDIKLPDIMTDSEDEDSDNDFEQPSWVNTPNLRELLTQQQLVDPEQVFGPIAPLNMEQVFPNKERHKRFRERTSSAYWANDQVTEEERRKDREAKERLFREGAWTYNPSPRPTPQPNRGL